MNDLSFSIAGMGALSALAYLTYFEKSREAEARKRLDFANMTPSQGWTEWLAFGLEMRKELYAKIQERDDIIARAKLAIEVTEGVRALAPRLSEDGIELEVQAWSEKARALFQLQGVDLQPLLDFLGVHFLGQTMAEEKAAREVRKTLANEAAGIQAKLRNAEAEVRTLQMRLDSATVDLQVTKAALAEKEKQWESLREWQPHMTDAWDLIPQAQAASAKAPKTRKKSRTKSATRKRRR